MDFEAALFRAVLEEEGAFGRFLSLGPDSADFDDQGARRVLTFLEGYVDEYGSLPSVELAQKVSRLNMEGDPGGTADYMIQQFVKRRLFRRTDGAIQNAHALLSGNDPEGAFRALEEFIDRTKGADVYNPPVSMFTLGQQVIENIENAKGGETGLEFPWPTMTRATNGMFPGTATLYVARPGVGKTFVAVIQARHSWKCEKRVLLVSPEMDKEEMAERFFVIDSRVSYGRVVQGNVTDVELKKLRQRVSDTEDLDGLWVLDGEDATDPRKIESAIKMLQPDIVCIDASYMLEFKGRNEKEQIDAMFKWARKTPKKLNTAFVLFHQLSRGAEKDVKKGGGARGANIALTDKGLWDMYNIFSLEQDADMKADRLMRIGAIKIRRPAFFFRELEVHWDFSDMRFDELERGESAGSSSGGFTDSGYDDEEDVPF